MARLFFILLAAAVCIAIAMVIYTAGTRAIAAGQRGIRPLPGEGRDGEMTPTGLQKVSYVALIVVLFGTASGWLGGL